MFKKLTTITTLLLTLMSCNAKEPVVVIETNYGTMKVKLYNETPQHRDNFLKLVNEGFYNDLLFHRVIKDFMIQGGDPESKNAPAGKQLGAGDVGYQIPAEFNYPKFMHKKGALSAARQGDQVNPEKKSSGCQFYIVQGKTYSDSELQRMEEGMKNQVMLRKFNELKKANMDKIKSMKINKDQEGLQALQQDFIKQCESYVAEHPEECKMSDEVKKIYKEIGGTPFLDGEYTVFGEIVEGLDIVDKIAAVETAPGDRPVQDVKMTKVYVEK